MSLQQIQDQINKVAASAGFRCQPVSWEDASRGTVGGSLSCWGGNISDVRLWEKSGKLLYTVRSDNWNERLGYVAAKDVAVVVGNHVPGGSQLSNVTLQNYLSNAKQYGSYAGLTTDSLSENQADQILSIRFQTVFLPVEGNDTQAFDDIAPEKLGRVEFCTDVYNYNTHSDDNPRNILLLCTAQGTSMQQDGAGTKKMFIHEVDPSNTIHRYWLEAERSKHKVGGSQKETTEEIAAAAARGKATATFIGTRAMGTRFNVQMLIQLPVKQKVEELRHYEWMSAGATYDECCNMLEYEDGACDDGFVQELDSDDDDDVPVATSKARRSASSSAPPKVGISNAARVSRGSEEDTWKGLTKKDAERDVSQHGTITVTMYYTVVGGIPSVDDVKAAIEDLNQLYKGCASDKKLVDCTEITKELTVKDINDIGTKLTTQAYQPPVKQAPASNEGGFPL